MQFTPMIIIIIIIAISCFHVSFCQDTTNNIQTSDPEPDDFTKTIKRDIPVYDAPPNQKFLIIDRHFRQGGLLWGKFFNYIMNVERGYLVVSREYINILEENLFLKQIWNIKQMQKVDKMIVFQHQPFVNYTEKAKNQDPPTYMTLARNPVDVFISQWNYCRFGTLGDGASDSGNLDEQRRNAKLAVCREKTNYDLKIDSIVSDDLWNCLGKDPSYSCLDAHYNSQYPFYLESYCNDNSYHSRFWALPALSTKKKGAPENVRNFEKNS